jgi:murein DD-endopeptidase MepM/ murein hydrolase activator NlpD
MRSLTCLCLSLCVLLAAGLPLYSASPVAAQGQDDCGVVDDIAFPIDGVSRDHDDFGMYRAWFSGYHAGVDMAFDRPGDTVRAAARGRVTFSDLAGWDTEKGVVVIEHAFPDGNTYFTLYGHMEESETAKFPAFGECINQGDAVGVIGRPSQSAPHLHYEVRKMRASTGGPGYWAVDPLDGGWLHPIDFTEQWQLRFRPEFRSVLTAATGLAMPPLWLSDGRTLLAERNYVDMRDAANNSLWRLNVRGLTGAILTADGTVISRTLTNQFVFMKDGRFVAALNLDRPVRSEPLLLGEVVVLVGDDDAVLGYNQDGSLRWRTPLNSRIERYVQSGDRLAVSAFGEGHKLWVVDASGSLIYQGTAPAPITPIALGDGAFLILVASQVALLRPDMTLETVLDVGQALGRNSQIARDAQGNTLVYPGHGNRLFYYDVEGALRWQQPLLVQPTQPPLLAMGSGCLAYALAGDGTLFALRPEDGSTLGTTRLFAGGTHYNPAARLLRVMPGEQVLFSPGYLSVATVDGATLGGVTC